MRFTLNEDLLRKNVFNKDTIKHKTGNKFKFLPFPANASGLKDEIIQELKDFKGIAGTCFRECIGLSHKNLINKETFIEEICLKANAMGNQNLIDMVEKMAFSTNGQLSLFNISVYPYIKNASDNPTLNNLGKFLISILFDTDDKENLKHLSKKEPENLFYKLILACIPSPETTTSTPEHYYQASDKTRAQFKVDLGMLIKDPEFFLSNFHELLKFYTFKYLSDLALELSQFFDDKKETIFFSVEWEKMQSYRLPIKNGWDVLKNRIEPLFSHAMTLELINHIDGFNLSQVSYKEIKKCIEGLNGDEALNLKSCLMELNEIYRRGITDVNWEEFNDNATARFDNEIEKEIYRLFLTIDFQFQKSNRDRAKLAFKSWVEEFLKVNFVKRRGQLGFSLNIDHELLLFLTRLCIGEEDKIRVSKLWDELIERGVFLDNKSQEHVIQYFEKINLLEKKSDSGDAQYVRKFNQKSV